MWGWSALQWDGIKLAVFHQLWFDRKSGPSWTRPWFQYKRRQLQRSPLHCVSLRSPISLAKATTKKVWKDCRDILFIFSAIFGFYRTTADAYDCLYWTMASAQYNARTPPSCSRLVWAADVFRPGRNSRWTQGVTNADELLLLPPLCISVTEDN